MSLQGFSPTSIAGCSAWYDASDSNSVTLTGNEITAVLDKSGSNNHLSNTGSSRFTYNVVKFQNQYPSFYNATATTNIIGSNATFSINQPMTFFLVGQSVLINVVNYLFSPIQSVAGSNIFLATNATTGVIFTSGGANIRNWVGTNNIVLSPFMVSCYLNGDSTRGFANGTNYTITTGTGTSGMTGLRLGNLYTQSSAHRGHICEVIFYSGLLTTFQRQQVEGYLYNKWGITALSPINPFRIYPAFQPTQFSNCAAWFDAADPSALSLLNGNQVTTWFDKSGNARNAINSFNLPTWNMSNAVVFNDGLYLNISSLTDVLPGNTFSIFFMSKRTSAQNSNYILAGTGNSDNNNIFFGYITETLASIGFFGAANRTTGTVPVYASSAEPRRLLTGTYTGTERQLFINGSLAGTSNDTTGVLSWSNPKMGLYEPDTLSPVSFIGEVNELLFFVPALSNEADRQLVEGYLSWKWNTNTSLPDSNPYRFVSPSAISFSNWPEVIEADSEYIPGTLLLPSTSVLQNRIVTIKDTGGTFSSVTVQANTGSNTLQVSTLFQTLKNPFDTQTYVASGQIWYPIEGSVQNALTTSSIVTNTLYTGSINYISSVATSSICMVDTVTNTLGNALIASTGYLLYGNEIVKGTNQASGFLFLRSQNTFSPSQLGSIHLWFDFADQNTVSLSGGNVTRVLDKSPFQRNATTTIGTPAYLLNAINNLPCVNFVPGQRMEGDFGLAELTYRFDTLSVFAVATSSSGDAGGSLFTMTRANEVASVVGDFSKCAPIGRQGITSIRVSINGQNIGGKTVSSNVPFMFSSEFSGTSIVTRLNGVNVGNTVTNFVTPLSTTTFSLAFGRSGGTSRYGGQLGELVVFSSFFTAADRQKVEGYLAWKWGLVNNLDPAHPYKTVPPSA